MQDKSRVLIETAGAISIVASLIFVGYQVQQANRIARLQVLQEHSAQWRETNLTMAIDPALVELMARVDDGVGREDFEPEERLALDLAYGGLIHGWEGNFKQLQLGVLDPDDIIFPRSDFPFYSGAYARQYWAQSSSGFSEDFRSFWEDRFNLLDG